MFNFEITYFTFCLIIVFKVFNFNAALKKKRQVD